MSEPNSKATLRASLIALYEQTGDEECRLAAECLNVSFLDQLLAIDDSKPGRPAENDNRALMKIARLVVSGKANSAHAAIQQVALKVRGNSDDAKVERLRKKYRANRADLEELARGQLVMIEHVRQSEAARRNLVQRARELLGKIQAD